MKKAVQLPVNAVIILALALIVLVAVVGMFQGSFTPSSETTQAQADFNSACVTFTNKGCCEVDMGSTSPGDACHIDPDGELASKAAAAGVSTDPGAIQAACCRE